MRAPSFWWKATPSPLARALAIVGWVWGAIGAWRMARPGADCGIPVICVGNFVAGGAGKTPVAQAIGEMLRADGLSPFFLTRGHGGAAGATPVRVDTSRHTAADVGDEALLLAREAPTIVAIDRLAGARAAVDAGASVVVMDDGFQNPSLSKTLSIIVVDAEVGIGNGLCIPAGPLRAPLAAQWARADAIVIMGAGERGEVIAAAARRRGTPVLRARLAADPVVAGQLRGRRVFAFAGIGRPEKFFATLAETGAEIVGRRAFADHRSFRKTEIDALIADAKRAGATLVTTEKDAVRLPPGIEAIAPPVRAEFADMDALRARVSRAVAR